MRSRTINGKAVILIKSTDWKYLQPREAFLIGKALGGATITKRDVNLAFAGFDHVVYVEKGPATDWPTTPREIDHQDIRSERPCT